MLLDLVVILHVQHWATGQMRSAGNAKLKVMGQQASYRNFGLVLGDSTGEGLRKASRWLPQVTQ